MANKKGLIGGKKPKIVIDKKLNHDNYSTKHKVRWLKKVLYQKIQRYISYLVSSGWDV